ncbi:hypothetical protein RCL1_001456 [Eukaryota sp. TZLM3-RCL]
MYPQPHIPNHLGLPPHVPESAARELNRKAEEFIRGAIPEHAFREVLDAFYRQFSSSVGLPLAAPMYQKLLAIREKTVSPLTNHVFVPYFKQASRGYQLSRLTGPIISSLEIGLDIFMTRIMMEMLDRRKNQEMIKGDFSRSSSVLSLSDLRVVTRYSFPNYLPLIKSYSEIP